MKINCKNKLCVFNAGQNCIKECVTLTNKAYCFDSVILTETEESKLLDYYYKRLVGKVKEETAKAEEKCNTLQKEVTDKEKIIADLKEEQHKSASDILQEARKKARTYSYSKGKNLKDSYSNSELEDLYVGQGYSIRSLSELTGIAKTTLRNRLKSAGIIDKKKAKEMGELE